MRSSLVRKLLLSRTLLTGVINAGVTWIILIIAPLGLFAVITCTVAVFVSSLVVGFVCDRAFLWVLNSQESGGRITGQGDFQPLDTQQRVNQVYEPFPHKEPPRLKD